MRDLDNTLTLERLASLYGTTVPVILALQHYTLLDDAEAVDPSLYDNERAIRDDITRRISKILEKTRVPLGTRVPTLQLRRPYTFSERLTIDHVTKNYTDLVKMAEGEVIKELTE